MSKSQILNLVILAVGVAAAIYYAAADNEAQGTVVLLLTVLAALTLPKLIES